ncbi:MAG: FAD-dependent oxidoreductase, partial [Pseudomonadota bacterium]
MSNPATEQTFDVIVVGGGVMGAATTLASSKAGKKTLLIDQFEPPHTHG